MSEAIVAVGLAASVLQFIDIGTKFAVTAFKIYKSAQNKEKHVPNLEKTTTDLQEILKKLQAPEGDVDDSGLQELLARCRKTANDLLASLRKVSSTQKGLKRDALMIAFKMIWKEEDLKVLQSELEGLKQELVLQLLALIREQGHKSVHQQEKILDQLGAVHEGTKRLENALSDKGVGFILLEILSSNVESSARGVFMEALRGDLIKAIHQNGEDNKDRLPSVPSITKHRKDQLQQLFLSHLRYPDMEDRQSRIAHSYEKTFEWIFQDKTSAQTRWSNFKEWLESDSQLYWITGKAGSGKSTLIKYICQPGVYEKNPNSGCESRCAKYLRKWAGDTRLLTASFFFWNSGVQLQTSQRGLLLSLLYQILQKASQLISVTSPSIWEAMCLFNDIPKEFTNAELHQMLRTAVKEASKIMKLCFFVDGLDEFDGQHDLLIHLFKDLIEKPNVKLCVSSRPWLVFEEEFKHKPSLMLQELTYADIKYYVTSSFQKNPGFDQLLRREPVYGSQLIENVVSKASGVFLWVNLVVSSLLAGINYGDRVSDLQRRLDLLPPDLEALYDKILKSLDPFYLEHATQLFKLVQACREPPSLILLSYAAEEDAESAVKKLIEPTSPADLLLRADTMRRRLNSRCKGFLEVRRISEDPKSDSRETVQYLHRTVKDFLESEETQKNLHSKTKHCFDPHLQICTGSLTSLKGSSTGNWKDARGLLAFWTYVNTCLEGASQVQPKNQARRNSLLDELDRTGSIVARNSFRDALSGRESLLDSQYKKKTWAATHPDFMRNTFFGGSFLSLIIRHGIVDYIDLRVNQGCLSANTRGEEWPLLLDAIYSIESRAFGPPNAKANPEMIACLLRHGADPNYSTSTLEKQDFTFFQRSLWFEVVVRIHSSYKSFCLDEKWAEIADSMIQHGAKVDKSLYNMLVELPHNWRGSYDRAFAERMAKSLFDELLAIKRRHAQGWLSWSLWH